MTQDCRRTDIVAPSGGTITLWRATLRLSDAAERAAFNNMLDAEERARAARFRRAQDHDRFIVAHGLVREILGAHVARSPWQVVFAYGAFGKPRLSPSHHPNTPQFNVSHANDQLLVAIGGGDVGVDIEAIRPLADRDAIAASTFSPDDRAAIDKRNEAERTDTFFQVWTAYEAYLKCRGIGLGGAAAPRGLAAVVGSERGATTAWHLIVGDGRYAVRPIDIAPGYAAALVTGV